ncbi:hypothetical protein XPA_001854 [Xanthoria parietina]
MPASSANGGLREGLVTAPSGPGSGQPQESKLASDFKENGLPFTDAFQNLKKTKAIEDKIAAGEALVADDFQQLMKDNSASEARGDASTKNTDAEAIFRMFTKQSEIMEKYTKQLELLEEKAKEPEPVEAVTAMVEQTYIQTEAILATVENEEDDFSMELQHQLETVLWRTEETLERMMGRLKRKAAAGQASGKAAAPGMLAPAVSSDSKV